jgi:ubiquinone/menaquinone biosynthesis C-methylase UbiE
MNTSATTSMLAAIQPYVKADAQFTETPDYLECPIIHPTEGLKANAHYFGNYEWAAEYLTYCHRSEEFKRRWEAALGNYEGKIVLDIGCGPGNIFATLGGKPKLLIGVDVAATSLKLAKKQGYLPLLADANDLPFQSHFADIVVLNATLHHCVDMEAVLREAARLVKPGGLLVTDHDPQFSAWNYKGPAKLLWDARLMLYKLIKKGFHKADDQQQWALACEIHHKPGHGVTTEFFQYVLVPEGFTVNVFPHNHVLGEEVFQGQTGKAELKYRFGNLLSGRDPDKADSALSLMCVARKMK